MATIFSNVYDTSKPSGVDEGTREEILREPPAFERPADFQTSARLKEWCQAEIAHGGLLWIVAILSFRVPRSRLKFKATPKERVHFHSSDLPLYTMPKRRSDQIVQNQETFPKKVGMKLQ